MVFKSYSANRGAKHFNTDLHLLAFIAFFGAIATNTLVPPSLVYALSYKVLTPKYNPFLYGPYFFIISLIGVLILKVSLIYTRQPKPFKTLTKS